MDRKEPSSRAGRLSLPAPLSVLALAALLGAAGTLHFLTPGPFEQLVPPALGRPGPWVAASGVAELACAAGLVPPRTRRAAAWATAALFVAVFPGNVQMALDWSDRPPLQRALAYGRLPLQLPLVLWAVAVARRPVPVRAPGPS